MAIYVHRSPLNFFDSMIGDYYRQMAQEMDNTRQRMFQLMSPEYPIAAVCVPGEQREREPLVPIVEENGERKMKLDFNVKNYKPEEVKVRMLNGNVLQVRAEHEEQDDNGEYVHRLYVRQYRVPKGVDIEHMRPSLSKDGVLTIEAPAPGLAPAERLIPIQFEAGNDEKQ